MLRRCAVVSKSAMPRKRRMIAIGSGGNRFPELLAAAHELRRLEGEDWEVAAGISAGAVVAGLLSQIPVGDYETFDHDFTRAREKFLKDHEASPFRPRVALGQWANALFCVLFGKSSLYRGMSAFVNKEFDEERFRESRRRLLVGVFDNEAQTYKTVDSLTAHSDVVREALIASCSIPVAMPEATVMGRRCRDGGLVHTIPVLETMDFIEESRHMGVQCHVDVLVSDAIESPPELADEKATVSSSLMNVTASLVWLNLERDLVRLCDVLGDTREEKQMALHLLRTGEKRNFKRPWGSLRLVAPVSLHPRRKERISFRIPDESVSRELIDRGIAAARASM